MGDKMHVASQSEIQLCVLFLMVICPPLSGGRQCELAKHQHSYYMTALVEACKCGKL